LEEKTKDHHGRLFEMGTKVIKIKVGLAEWLSGREPA
jgi:hypothetical protein